MPTLYRKYRPDTWSAVTGQTHIIKTLTNAIAHNSLAHSYIFTGSRGIGKTTVARLLARSINCTERNGAEPCFHCANCRAFEEGRAFDIIEIDGASNNGVDHIRELRETVKLSPTIGAKKIYIIDEAHMLSVSAWNALLKTLEEPPAHVIFIFATTELHKFPETIISRCQRFDFGKLPINLIVSKLTSIAEKEHVTIDADALEMIAIAAEGGMRDAESLLAHVMSLEDAHITAAEVSTLLGISERVTVIEFVEALGKHDLNSAIFTLHKLSEAGADFRSFSDAVAHFLRELLLVRLDDTTQKKFDTRSSSTDRDTIASLSQQFSFSDLMTLMELIQRARKEVRFATLPEIPLEIATLSFLFPEDRAAKIPLETPPRQSTIATTPSVPQSQEHTHSSSENSTHAQEVLPETPRTTKNPPLTPSGTSPKEISPNTREEVSKKNITPSPEASPATKNNDAITISLSSIREQWLPFIEEIKRRNASLAMLLTGSDLKSCVNGTVTVIVRHGFHKERLDNPLHRSTVDDALTAIFKTPLRIAVELAPKNSPEESEAIINSAMNILGGRVVH